MTCVLQFTAEPHERVLAQLKRMLSNTRAPWAIRAAPYDRKPWGSSSIRGELFPAITPISSVLVQHTPDAAEANKDFKHLNLLVLQAEPSRRLQSAGRSRREHHSGPPERAPRPPPARVTPRPRAAAFCPEAPPRRAGPGPAAEGLDSRGPRLQRACGGTSAPPGPPLPLRARARSVRPARRRHARTAQAPRRPLAGGRSSPPRFLLPSALPPPAPPPPGCLPLSPPASPVPSRPHQGEAPPAAPPRAGGPPGFPGLAGFLLAGWPPQVVSGRLALDRHHLGAALGILPCARGIMESYNGLGWKIIYFQPSCGDFNYTRVFRASSSLG